MATVPAALRTPVHINVGQQVRVHIVEAASILCYRLNNRLNLLFLPASEGAGGSVPAPGGLMPVIISRLAILTHAGNRKVQIL